MTGLVFISYCVQSGMTIKRAMHTPYAFGTAACIFPLYWRTLPYVQFILITNYHCKNNYTQNSKLQHRDAAEKTRLSETEAAPSSIQLALNEQVYENLAKRQTLLQGVLLHHTVHTSVRPSVQPASQLAIHHYHPSPTIIIHHQLSIIIHHRQESFVIISDHPSLHEKKGKQLVWCLGFLPGLLALTRRPVRLST